MNAKDSDKKSLENAAIYCDDLIVFIDNVQGMKTESASRPVGYAAILCTHGHAGISGLASLAYTVLSINAVAAKPTGNGIFFLHKRQSQTPPALTHSFPNLNVVS